ncbi:MAG: hypothetical protein FJ189_06585, partial [Gammaproteobacteria bacterium]|nr:hypothetical protein [Gammaproteobacteria bacterium]
MYLKHYGFDAAPFAINPDPRFLYLSPQHQEALAHLLYGLGEGGGFVMLSGEVGAGKTTLCYSLLEHLGDGVDVAFIMNPRLGAGELLAALCDELHVSYPPATESRKTLIDALNGFLLANHAQGRRTVAVIDEAQHLSVDVLEQIRLLTNLETPTTKLLQIILVGQPELSVLLARPEVRQVDQRITARYHLGPLSKTETRAYVKHRLMVAGGPSDLFSPKAQAEIFRASRGVPRLINVICDRALLGAYTLDRIRVDAAIVRKAVREVHRTVRSAPVQIWPSLIAVLFVAVTAASLLQLVGRSAEEPRLPSASVPAVSEPQAVAAARDPEAGQPATPPVAVPATSEAAATGPGTPQPTLLAWVADPFFQEGHALGQVVQRWRPQEVFIARSCTTLAAAGLSCLRLQSGWDRLMRQNLPAALKLRLRNGMERSVALVGADGHWVQLAGRDGQAVPFPLPDLLPLWTG